MLTRVKVSGYKSLKDVDVELGKLSVIAGPNNVGKSNFFDLLQVLSAFADGPIERAFDKHRGDPLESFFDPEDLRITVQVDIDLTGHRLPPKEEEGLEHPKLTYRVAVQWDEDRSLFTLTDESLVSASRRSKKPFIGIDEASDRLRVTREGGGGHPRYFDLGGTRTVLSQIDDAELYPTIYAVQQHLRSWRFYHFEPEALREPSPQLNLFELDAQGHGLSGVLDTLRRDLGQSKAFASIERELRSAVPEVQGLDLVDTGDRRRLVQLRVGDKEFTGRVVSDGILRFLALLVLAYSPRPGGLVCFEEPENGVHPGRLGFVVQHMRGIARERSNTSVCQVLVNSHSPYLIDHLRPEELVVASVRQDGATVLRRLPQDLEGHGSKSELRKSLESGDVSLGEAWCGGLLDEAG
ncbi:AAA family ATPase [bacterium]|nr:AAA family ATPase [bacterium]